MRPDLHKRVPYEMPKLIFETHASAHDVLKGMRYCLDLYGCVSVGDMLDLAEEPSNWMDHKYGWTSLSCAFVKLSSTSRGHEIILPKPIPLTDDIPNETKKEKETMKRDPFTMTNICANEPTAHMTIGGETFPVKIKNVTCDSADRFTSSTTITVEIPGYYTPIVMPNKRIHSREYYITRVIFNNPATIVFWSDGTKTVVKRDPRDEFDPEKGLAMAIAKKSLGNNCKYYEVFEKFIPSTCLEEETIKDVFSEMMMNEALTVADKLKEKIEEQKELRDCSSCNYVGCSPKLWPCSPCLSKCLDGEPHAYWTRKEK